VLFETNLTSSSVEFLLDDWRENELDWGQRYLEYEPVTPPDQLLVEDLAVTMLINSRVSARAATSVARNGATLDLGSLPEPRQPRPATAHSRKVCIAVRPQPRGV
jgi:hypothetical protein